MISRGLPEVNVPLGRPVAQIDGNSSKLVSADFGDELDSNSLVMSLRVGTERRANRYVISVPSRLLLSPATEWPLR